MGNMGWKEYTRLRDHIRWMEVTHKTDGSHKTEGTNKIMGTHISFNFVSFIKTFVVGDIYQVAPILGS